MEVFARYPNQVFWQLVAILKSSFKTRSGRCEEVIRPELIGSLKLGNVWVVVLLILGP